MLDMRWSDKSGLRTLRRAVSQLETSKIRKIGKLALNKAGQQARTATVRALRDQTGLKSKVLRRALKVRRARAGKLEYRIDSYGGDVALKFFAARETRKGVSAKPFNKRQIFRSTFIKGGRFPARTDLGMGRQVFMRSGSGRLPISKQKSGVVIPSEMVKDESADAWNSTVGTVLPARIEHELRRMTKGAFSR
ncbi:phage tail protein [Roseibium album]|uniref:phage tail protein n=1 Tax=Roseibium album TaxID=311410 RepID=UPI0039191219